MSRLIRCLIPLILLGLGYWAWSQLSQEEAPEAKRKPKRTEVKATVRPLLPQNYQVLLQTQGDISAHNKGSLTSRVSGQVVKISPHFEVGAFFKKDDILVELDDSDFQSAISAAQARLARTEADLTQEIAQGKQASLNWTDLGYTEPPSDLVLRKPQLKQAQAAVVSAQAELDQAQRNLDRTQIRAPYNGRVSERNVSVGSSVGTNSSLGEIFSTDFAEVRLPLDTRQLQFIHLPEHPDDPPLDVTFIDPARNTDLKWKGQIVRTEGQLDQASRELFVIARIEDPFGLKNHGSPLRIDQPIRASIKAFVLKDVFVISRQYLHNLSEIILISQDEHRIERRQISPLWTSAEEIVVREGIKEGDLLSITPLSFAPKGGKVVITYEADLKTPPAAKAPSPEPSTPSAS